MGSSAHYFNRDLHVPIECWTGPLEEVVSLMQVGKSDCEQQSCATGVTANISSPHLLSAHILTVIKMMQ